MSTPSLEQLLSAPPPPPPATTFLHDPRHRDYFIPTQMTFDDIENLQLFGFHWLTPPFEAARWTGPQFLFRIVGQRPEFTSWRDDHADSMINGRGCIHVVNYGWSRGEPFHSTPGDIWRWQPSAQQWLLVDKSYVKDLFPPMNKGAFSPPAR